MSIASIGGLGGLGLSSFLNQIQSPQTTGGIDDGSACAGASSSDATSSSSTDSTGTSKGMSMLSSEILALLIQLQAQSGSAASDTTASSSSSASVAAANTTSSSTSSTSSTTANPITSLFSSLDANNDGTVSQSEFQSYIEKVGSTQSQADALFSQLTQNNNTSGLTEQQLAQDASGFGPPPPPPPSAGQVADSLVNAMGGSNGSVTKSEFENFVTSNGGTTAEADADFAALDTSGSTSLSASDLEKAIQNQQQASTASSTSVSLLSWLDSLSTTASGTPSA